MWPVRVNRDWRSLLTKDMIAARTISTISPRSLFKLACNRLARENERPIWYGDIRTWVTDAIRLDLYLELKKECKWSTLSRHLGNPKLLLPLLNMGQRRTQLHQLMQSCIDQGYPIQVQLTRSTGDYCSQPDNLNALTKKLHLGLNLAYFLCDAGWYESAETVLMDLIHAIEMSVSSLSSNKYAAAAAHPFIDIEPEYLLLQLRCLSSYNKFKPADALYRRLVCQCLPLTRQTDRREKQCSLNPRFLPCFFSEFSSHCFRLSQYELSYSWSMMALKYLEEDKQNSSLSPKLTIDILKQAGKSYVVKREFEKARILIEEAVLMSKEVFGEEHYQYADALTHYGFYWLNVDNITKSMHAYQTALQVLRTCFGGESNLRVSFAYENLAYVTYVKEYNNRRFKKAKNLVEKSLGIMCKIYPDNHMLQISSKRVLALILEEIAVDESSKEERELKLKEVEKLHMSALSLALSAFGTMNVQTSKHYGNLGRLYQSMGLYREAEDMHLKAIDIKEKLLGKDDYELVLSIGHLASLYNYDLKEYQAAERLYLRSINTGIRLFGEAYSGLEYDYRGLVRVYGETGQYLKYAEYQNKLDEWKILRDELVARERNKGEEVLSSKDRKAMSFIVTAVLKDEKHQLIEQIDQAMLTKNVYV